MPNKTIYVAEDDLPLFERAQELSGDNLSSAIVRALRRFIEIEEARQSGLDEITVPVGADGVHQRKRFMGVRLVRWIHKKPKGKGIDILNVYHTAGKRFVLHTHTMLDWEYSWGDPEYFGDAQVKNSGLWGRIFGNWGWDWKAYLESGEYTFYVFETLDELKAHISDDLYKAVVQVLNAPPLEELDI